MHMDKTSEVNEISCFCRQMIPVFVVDKYYELNMLVIRENLYLITQWLILAMFTFIMSAIKG